MREVRFSGEWGTENRLASEKKGEAEASPELCQQRKGGGRGLPFRYVWDLGMSPSVQWTVKEPVLKFQNFPFLMAFHCALVPLKVMFVRPVQSSNAWSPMLVTLSGIVMLLRP